MGYKFLTAGIVKAIFSAIMHLIQRLHSAYKVCMGVKKLWVCPEIVHLIVKQVSHSQIYSVFTFCHIEMSFVIRKSKTPKQPGQRENIIAFIIKS